MTACGGWGRRAVCDLRGQHFNGVLVSPTVADVRVGSKVRVVGAWFDGSYFHGWAVPDCLVRLPPRAHQVVTCAER